MSLSVISFGSKVILRGGSLRAERGMAVVLDFPHLRLSALDTLFTLPMPTEADLPVRVPRFPCPLVSGWVQPVVSPGRRSEERGRLRSHSLLIIQFPPCEVALNCLSCTTVSQHVL